MFQCKVGEQTAPRRIINPGENLNENCLRLHVGHTIANGQQYTRDENVPGFYQNRA